MRRGPADGAGRTPRRGARGSRRCRRDRTGAGWAGRRPPPRGRRRRRRRRGGPGPGSAGSARGGRTTPWPPARRPAAGRPRAATHPATGAPRAGARGDAWNRWWCPPCGRSAALLCRSWFHDWRRPQPEEAALATIAAFAHEGLTAARTRTVWVQRGLTVLTFGAIYLVLLKTLQWNLILTRTTAAGGDMGSHHYVATFLREELLPRGRVTGWAPGWFAGIPMLTFYFPLPYVLIAVLTLPLGDQVAFKLVTVLGLLALPVTCWASFRVLRLREPAPLLAACAACVFLFMTQVTPTEQFTIWGGNIASTMAGEFPFSISFALLPLALVMGVAFCLTAFWALPFLLRVQYTAHFRWDQKSEYSLLFPNEIRPYLLFALVGLVVAVARGERRVLLYAWPAAAAAFVFVALIRIAPQAALWNARMLPFLYLFSLLVAAYGASVVAGWLAGVLQRRTGVALRYAWLAVVVLMVVTPVIGSWRHRGFVPSWTKYNYEGFEVKDGWPEARALFDTLATLPPGRVMWEFNHDFERFGTTRTLENMPVFGGQPTMEGLLIESSINAPFH